MTIAAIGYGSTFGIDNAKSGIYTTVAEVVSIKIPGFMREAIDATHMTSPDKYKEYIAGLKDMSEATITLNWVPSVTDVLVAAFEDEDANYQITAPNGVRFRFSGFVTEYSPPELTNEKMEASVTFRPTGKMTLLAPV